MDIAQIRQAALNSLYAHKDHLDTLRKNTANSTHPPAGDEIRVVDVKQYTQPTTQGVSAHPVPQGVSLPTPPALPIVTTQPALSPMPPLTRQKPSPYPRQHAPPPPATSKPTFLGLLGGHPVYQSVFDLRRLGLRFDEILQQSGCSEEFLRHIFKQLGYSIESVVQTPMPPIPTPVAAVQQTQIQSQSSRTQPVMTFEQFRKTRSELNTPTPQTPPIGAAAFNPAYVVPVRSIPRFGEKSRRQKRLCIEISDSESDSASEGVVSKKHKDMSLEETRLEISRIRALIAQQNASSRNGTPSHEDSEASETNETAAIVEKSPLVEEAAGKLEYVVQIAAAAPKSGSPASPPLPVTPAISPEVQAYLNSKHIALESLSAVQLDKIVQIVKLKTLLQGEEDAFTTSLKSATQPHSIPQPDIPPPATRQPNQSDTEGIDASDRAPSSHSHQQQSQAAHVVSMANTEEQIGVTNELSGVGKRAWRGHGKIFTGGSGMAKSCIRFIFFLWCMLFFAWCTAIFRFSILASFFSSTSTRSMLLFYFSQH